MNKWYRLVQKNYSQYQEDIQQMTWCSRLLDIDLHVVKEPDISKPRSNTKHCGALDLFQHFQTFLVYNLSWKKMQ